jgi:endopeptidase La
MSDKQINPKKEIQKKTTNDIVMLIEKKVLFFQDVIQKTIIHVQKNKLLDIVSVGEVNNCISTLFELSSKLKDINEQTIHGNTDNIINILQYINNEISVLFKTFGTSSFEDLLWICCGNNSVNTYAISDMEKQKFDILKKHFHPTSYKLLNTKKTDNTDERILNEKSKNLDSIDVNIKTKSFHLKVCGIQLIVHNPQYKKSLIISGIIDDLFVDVLNNKFINLKIQAIKENIPLSEEFKGETFKRFIESLTLKDYLLYEPHEIYSKFIGYMTNLNLITQHTISQIVKDFVASDLYNKRLIIMQLLIKSDKYDNQYLAYLLYDLLSNDVNGNIDTQEQIMILDSFPWSIRTYFKEAMKETIEYTNELTHFDTQKIPLEQQICLLKASVSVKEKAMQKLKEVKAKSEDSGSKARQYLDGLLKIPFNIYKKEPILDIMSDIRQQFIAMIKKSNISSIENKNNYTSLEIIKHIKTLKLSYCDNNINTQMLEQHLLASDKGTILEYIMKINENINVNKSSIKKIKQSNNRKKSDLISDLLSFVETNKENNKLFDNVFVSFKKEHFNEENTIKQYIERIEDSYSQIKSYMSNVKTTLDKAVHGHDKAKKQIERIIGQWINGEQSGYCFGFEGPPGTGKTSLAKRGLSNCLKDANGTSRPFAMIQMGGDTNGSSLHGHNYTYVGSTWGSIVQILIDKRCMNPIIFIDEVDKISKTEHGKEIIGILTHLLDSTQNDCFQDKYFSGIDLDLSKALFVLSYNDPDTIDKILLDRVHRIKFKNLSLEDKITISNIHLLPEIYKKMGLENMIRFDDDVLKYIIDEYTSEPGVRKLKEILFEIVGEINLDILKNMNDDYNIPIEITIEDIKNKYFKDKYEIKHKKIHTISKIGVINGLWANAMGRGGVIPIQVNWRPSKSFLELNLTGMQGDVMKESMNVALTLAWNMTTDERKEELRNEYLSNKNGIHIHCPEGATPKDGPSAGTAITTAIFSLFNKLNIRYNFAITGEICLNGRVTEIGGLDLKFLGGIKAGIKEFIYPKENQKDYDTFMDKYKDDDIIKDIKFHSVETIDEVFCLIFDK